MQYFNFLRNNFLNVLCDVTYLKGKIFQTLY